MTVLKGRSEWSSCPSLPYLAMHVALKASALVFVSAALLMLLLARMHWLETSLGSGMLLAALMGLISAVIGGWMAWKAGSTIERLRENSRHFERLSRLDALSGLLNRRAFSEALAAAGEETTLMIMDIDRFKTINDTYGHAIGDAVIMRVSALIDSFLGTETAIGRLGGEEFGAILKGPSREARSAMADALRQRISEGGLDLHDRNLRISISAGLAEIGGGRSADQVYASADKALYLAKATGRDRVVHEQQALSLIVEISQQEGDAGQMAQGGA